MSHRHKVIKYGFPGSKQGDRQKTFTWWALTLLVGLSVAVVAGLLTYLAGRF